MGAALVIDEQGKMIQSHTGPLFKRGMYRVAGFLLVREHFGPF